MYLIKIDRIHTAEENTEKRKNANTPVRKKQKKKSSQMCKGFASTIVAGVKKR